MSQSDAKLEALCEALFAGPLGHWAGSLTFRDHPDAIDATELVSRDVFESLLTRFSRAYPGADRLALTSFWSQTYFAKLIILLTAFCLTVQRPVALDVGALRVRFCPETGAPLSFHLRSGGPARTPERLVKALYEEQVAGMVALLRRHSGLSARLLWENAGSYGMWVLGEIVRRDPGSSPVAMGLLRDGQWPRAGCTMLMHMKRAACESRPCLRRVCCLRYRLPGVARCAGTCPLADQDGAANQDGNQAASAS